MAWFNWFFSFLSLKILFKIYLMQKRRLSVDPKQHAVVNLIFSHQTACKQQWWYRQGTITVLLATIKHPINSIVLLELIYLNNITRNNPQIPQHIPLNPPSSSFDWTNKGLPIFLTTKNKITNQQVNIHHHVPHIFSTLKAIQAVVEILCKFNIVTKIFF